MNVSVWCAAVVGERRRGEPQQGDGGAPGGSEGGRERHQEPPPRRPGSCRPGGLPAPARPHLGLGTDEGSPHPAQAHGLQGPSQRSQPRKEKVGNWWKAPLAESRSRTVARRPVLAAAVRRASGPAKPSDSSRQRTGTGKCGGYRQGSVCDPTYGCANMHARHREHVCKQVSKCMGHAATCGNVRSPRKREPGVPDHIPCRGLGGDRRRPCAWMASGTDPSVGHLADQSPSGGEDGMPPTPQQCPVTSCQSLRRGDPLLSQVA